MTCTTVSYETVRNANLTGSNYYALFDAIADPNAEYDCPARGDN